MGLISGVSGDFSFPSKPPKREWLLRDELLNTLPLASNELNSLIRISFDRKEGQLETGNIRELSKLFQKILKRKDLYFLSKSTKIFEEAYWEVYQTEREPRGALTRICKILESVLDKKIVKRGTVQNLQELLDAVYAGMLSHK